MNQVIDLPVRSYRDLRAWQLSKKLSIAVYRATEDFPKIEQYGLTNQMRRAAVSVPSNIAEGHARSTKEYIRFINIALGSLAELETQIEIALELDYLPSGKATPLLEDAHYVTNMLGKLNHALKQKFPNPKSQHPNPEGDDD